ncbi:MAG: bifunctional phosphopantothenoylcysteine decarboxylase/phosphopantothenate--cysteine ligase CoaBC [Anaerovoracaceae bacterium]|jgi:phosphopantothenoylcysteine decarboxylase/phosphopantothenate--cysteine ligase
MLDGKTVILGVSGSIAAYKTAALASALKKQHCDVHVIMTENACQFITPLTFETLTGHRCITDTFDRNFEFNVAHVSLAQAADLIMIAPATANVIAKLAHGIADDMLTTTVLAARCPVLVSPAMNTAMYENAVTRANLNTLENYGFEIIEPATGLLACNYEGKGKMPEPAVLQQHIEKHIARYKDLSGSKVLVTAGPTMEPIDPVRYITNHSSGRMGFELARACMLRGARVTLISGSTSLEPPLFVDLIRVGSAAEMYDAVIDNFDDADFVFKAAAVADYTPAAYHDDKIKKSGGEATIKLTRTRDILAELGRRKRDDQFICGFSMETKDLLQNSTAKLEAKNADMIVANNLKIKGAGFGTDTNVVTIITKDGCEELPTMSKFEVADAIIDRAL